eukprot:gene9992-23648_t
MTKITFKTLKNDKFQLDVEDTLTIGDVKDKVAEERSMLREKMKLILSGKILKDTQTVAECAIKETDFLVIMGKPKPAAPAPAAAAAAATPAPAAAAPAADAPPPAAAAAAAATDTPPAAAAAAPAAASADAAPSMGTPEQIAELESMGFPRSQAEAALRAAFGNQQRATEYLLNPESMPQASSAPPPAAAADGSASMDSTADDPATTASGASGDHPTLSQSSPLYQYLDSPQFTSLRGTLQQRPELLPSILQQIAQNQPDMAQLFNANREDFYILLNSPLPGQGGGGGGGGGGGQPRGGFQVQVTPEEQAAIQRLCDLGFDRNEVIQAYIACDKNEELAANFLFMDR